MTNPCHFRHFELLIYSYIFAQSTQGSKTKIEIFFISVSREFWLTAFSKRFNIFNAFTQGGKNKNQKKIKFFIPVLAKTYDNTFSKRFNIFASFTQVDAYVGGVVFLFCHKLTISGQMPNGGNRIEKIK
jgi:hypothetical protein